jgi:BioD-like phosphotransacetylase family protein
MAQGTGKTAVGAGLGRYWQGKGKRVGFFKPVMADGDQPQVEASRRDGLFMKQVLGLAEPVDSICPIIARGELAKDAYARVSSGKDVVITEGVYEPAVVSALDARVIAVEGYDSTGMITGCYKDLGERLLGVVVNKVPVSRLERVRDEVTAQLKGAKVRILGVLPEDRLLLTLTIGELAESIHGEILNSAGQSAELVENFMLGAMTVDPGPEYYSRKSSKAVVTRGERPDMQLAALETSTRCLILCGSTLPTAAVRYRAEIKKVPIILTRGGIAEVVDSIEDALGKGRFSQERKLPRLAEIMEQNFSFPALNAGLS